MSTDKENTRPFEPTPEELEALEREAREKYMAECLKNFRFTPFKKAESSTSHDHTGDDFNGIKDLKLLLSMIHKRFTGNPTDLRTFLDQTHNAYELCHPTLRQSLLAIIFNEIEGEPREKLRERPDIDSYQKLRNFLKEHYEPRESFAQAYSKLSNAKQEHNETVRQFADRLTTLAYHAKIASRKESKTIKEVRTVDDKPQIVETTTGLSPEAATQMIEFMALERFKVGSRLAVSRFIRCNPFATTLHAAIDQAIEFETKETQEAELQQQVKGKWCKNHNVTTHTTAECRLNKDKSDKPSTSKFCTYCRIPGHLKAECHRRREDELKKNPPTNPSIATSSCKYCKATDHEIRNYEILAQKKRTNPEKYDRTHPNFKGTQKQEKKTEESNEANKSANQPKENRRIALCSNKRAIVQMNSPSINSGTARFLVDGGADISLVKYESLTEKARQLINTNIVEAMFDLSNTESKSIGKVPIRVIVKKRVYEFDFHVVKGYGQSMPHDGLLGTDHLESTRSIICLLYTSPSPRDRTRSRMPSSA